jgi:phosphoribosyl 1,2-cyclic phosphate phosphodiesterase
MHITFLGTGTSQGVPMIGCKCKVCTSTDPKDNRLRSSILVSTDSTTIIVDTGPDFRQQMLRTATEKIDAILFTHAHKDHLAGLDDVRAFNFVQQKAIPVYASDTTWKGIKREFEYIFAEHKYPGIPELIEHAITTEPFVIGDISIQPITVMHYKLPVTGFIFNQQFAYITDANFIDEQNLSYIQNIPHLVLNALRWEEHISHYSVPQAIEIANQVQAKQIYLTHISHQLGLHEEQSQNIPTAFSFAYDGLKVYL